MQFGAQLSNYGTAWADIERTVTTIGGARRSTAPHREMGNVATFKRIPPTGIATLGRSTYDPSQYNRPSKATSEARMKP